LKKAFKSLHFSFSAVKGLWDFITMHEGTQKPAVAGRKRAANTRVSLSPWQPNPHMTPSERVIKHFGVKRHERDGPELKVPQRAP